MKRNRNFDWSPFDSYNFDWSPFDSAFRVLVFSAFRVLEIIFYCVSHVHTFHRISLPAWQWMRVMMWVLCVKIYEHAPLWSTVQSFSQCSPVEIWIGFWFCLAAYFILSGSKFKIANLVCVATVNSMVIIIKAVCLEAYFLLSGSKTANLVCVATANSTNSMVIIIKP